MNGDVLVPVLVTLLVVNVILIIRAVVRRQLGHRDVESAGKPAEPEVANGVAPVSVGPVVAAGPSPVEPDEGVAAMTSGPMESEDDPSGAPAPVEPEEAAPSAPSAPVEPDAADVQPPSAHVGRDLLTGLDDRASWDRRVADETVRARRYRRPVTIVSIELDGLDRLDALLGADAGDRLVRAMADTLRRLARDTDAIARVGRGGFGVLMPETSADAATRYVERVSRACELWLESAATTVRLAIGWAAGSGDTDLAEIERLAIELRRVDRWQDVRRTAVTASAEVCARLVAG